MVVIRSRRLELRQFQMKDAPEVFRCITPAIVKFMPWEPPSWSGYVARCERRVRASDPNKFSFVIRRLENGECLGMASFEDADSVSPEVGLWIRESAHWSKSRLSGVNQTQRLPWCHTIISRHRFYSAHSSRCCATTCQICQTIAGES